MATITATTNEKVFSIPRWLGLNEHPDGDTRLKMGEASTMVNWKITRDGNLKRRPGMEYVAGLNSDYEVSIDSELTTIGTYASTAEFEAYAEVSATDVPGVITFVGSGGHITNGTLTGVDATISDGVLTVSSSVATELNNDGELHLGNMNTYTAAELYTALRSLEDGEYLYINVMSGYYALNNGCITISGNKYVVSGYMVSAVVVEGTAKPVNGLWKGVVNGKMMVLAACSDVLWSLYDEDSDTWDRAYIYGGTDSSGNKRFPTDKSVSFIPWDGNVYILNGYEFYCFDGETVTAVEGYRPLVAIVIGPEGTTYQSGTTTGEYINRLNGQRRVWLSPDGSGTVFHMPENNLASFDYVRWTTNGEDYTDSYSTSTEDGTITFSNVLQEAVNSIEVGYTIATTLRSNVTGNLFAEYYSGVTDSRVYIYGDGTNRALYSGMDYDGQPRIDYFPDLSEVRVGEANTPITAMIRHYSDLLCFKTDSAWVIKEGSIEDAVGNSITAIYCTPVNKTRGHLSPGQIALVENNPVTCSGQELYHWINSSYYTSQLSRDERQARRISDRVQRSIKSFDLETCCMCDDNDGQELYIGSNGVMLIWNYAADAWYRYEGIDARRIIEFYGEIYIGSTEGKIVRLSYDVDTDYGYPIVATWESGAMDFGMDYERKYSSMMWVGLKPEDGTSVDVTVITDKKNTFREKVISAEKAKVDGEPFMVRTKIKAKKFEYYRLVLSVNEKMPAVTVNNIDFRVRYTGYAK